MSDDADVPALVLDIGSGRSKVGFAGDDAPKSVFTSTIGRRLVVSKTIHLHTWNIVWLSTPGGRDKMAID